MKELYHTSPKKIESIYPSEWFGRNLFFASQPYYMSNASKEIYKIKIYQLETIESSDLFNHKESCNLEELVKEFAEEIEESTGIEYDLEIIRGLIDGSECAHDIIEYDCDYAYEKVSSISFRQQYFACECAKVLGYIGVELRDEQGTAYLIDADFALKIAEHQEEE